MCLTLTCISVRGGGKVVLFWQLIRFISLTTKHIIYFCQQPDTQDGHIGLYITVIMNFFYFHYSYQFYDDLQFRFLHALVYMTTLFHGCVSLATPPTCFLDDY